MSNVQIPQLMPMQSFHPATMNQDLKEWLFATMVLKMQVQQSLSFFAFDQAFNGQTLVTVTIYVQVFQMFPMEWFHLDRVSLVTGDK